MQRKKPVFYWDGIIDPQQLTANYADVISRLMNAEYRELNLEKLHGHQVFSIRINRSDRLLFTTVVMNNAPHVMVLDVVLNHEYHKSRFLKPNVLRNYLEMNGKALEEGAITDDLFAEEETLDLPDEAAECDYVAAEYFQNKVVVLSDDQRAVSQSTRLPVVVNGAAGSGKSCVAMSVLSHYIASHRGQLKHPIVYVAESATLCNSMRRNWAALPIAQGEDSQLVQFKTYKQLLLENDMAVAGLEEASQTTFVTFMQERVQSQKQQDKAKRVKSFAPDFFKNLDVMYQEFRIISGCDSWDVYAGLGKRQSLIDEADKRKWLYAEFENYVAYLSANKLMDYSFYRSTIANLFELVVVDESQDFSHLQLEILCRAAINGQICYCEDARQSLSDNLPKETFFKRLLAAKDGKVNFRELSATYRCPVAVEKVASEVTAIGATLSGQRHAGKTVIANRENIGNAVWLSELPAATMQTLRAEAASPDVAIITQSHLLQEARERFQTALVFTVEDIKGLEYRKILVYRLLDAKIYIEANQLIDTMNAKGSKGFTNEKFGPAFNAFYTACTRATESLVIIQDDKGAQHQIRFIAERLRKLCGKTPEQQSQAVTDKQLQENWFKQARELVINGNIAVARDIFVNKLQKASGEFDAFVTMHTGEKPVAIVADKVAPSKTKRKKKKVKPAKVLPVTEEEFKKMCRSQLLSSAEIKRLFTPFATGSDHCPFTQLFYAKVTRHLLLSIIIPVNAEKIAPYLTESMLSELHADVATNVQRSALHWICYDEIALSALKRSPDFIRVLTGIAKNNPVVLLREPLKNGKELDQPSAWYWLSCHDDDKVCLSAIFRDAPSIVKLLTHEMVFKKYQGVHDRRTSFIDNLLLAGSDISVLISLLRISAGSISGFRLEHLFPPSRPSELPLLYSLYGAPQFKALLKVLSEVYPGEFSQDTLALLNRKMIIYFDDTFQVLQMGNDKQHYLPDNDLMRFVSRFLPDLLCNPGREELEAIFSDKHWYYMLFILPLKHQRENLFVTLFDIPKARAILLEHIIPNHAAKLKNMLPATALTRADIESTKPSPLFWMMGSSVCAAVLFEWIYASERLRIAIGHDALFKTTSLVDYMGASLPASCSALHGKTHIPVIQQGSHYCAYTLAMLSEGGRRLMPFILGKSEVDNAALLQSLSFKSIIEKPHNTPVTPALILSRSNAGVMSFPCVVERLKTPSEFDDFIRMLCADAKTNKQGDFIAGEYVLSHIIAQGESIALTKLFQQVHIKPLKLMLYALLRGLRQGAVDDTLSTLFIGLMCVNVELLRSVTKFIKHYPELVADADPELLTEWSKPKSEMLVGAFDRVSGNRFNYNIKDARQMLRVVDGGKQFVALVTGILTNMNASSAPAVRAISMFSPATKKPGNEHDSVNRYQNN